MSGAKRVGRYPDEMRERAVRMVFEHQHEYPSQWKAIESIAKKLNAATPVPPVDLWGDDVNVAGGKVQVYDKDGKLITTLSLPGIAPEQGLIDAGLKPQTATPEQPPAKSEPNK